MALIAQKIIFGAITMVLCAGIVETLPYILPVLIMVAFSLAIISE